MTKVYYENDADLEVLKGKKIAVIGFGSQGHAHALNLRDSGLDVIVGELEGSASWKAAESQGLSVATAAEAAKAGDLIIFLTPDELQRAIYHQEIKPNLTAGNALFFAHGFNIHFFQIIPEPDIDVLMVAPKGPGRLVRQTYVEGQGVPALFAVYQDYTGKGRDTALAYAKGIGSARAGVLETTFKEETETDLFGEQVVLCGGTTELIKASFETLVEAGYQPEIAYFECLHELKLIVDLIYERGITGMRQAISNTAEYGDMSRGPRIINDDVRAEMKKILKEIQSGAFAREWVLENQAGRPVYNALSRQGREHVIEQIGSKLRAMMSWIKK